MGHSPSNPPQFSPPNFGDWQQKFQDWRAAHPFPNPQVPSPPTPPAGGWGQQFHDRIDQWRQDHPFPPHFLGPPTPAPAPAPAPAPVPHVPPGNHWGWNQNHNPHSGMGWNQQEHGGSPWNNNPHFPNVFHPLNPGAGGTNT